MIFFTTIVGSFCSEPAKVEVSTALPATENDQQKRSIVSDCDGPIVGGLVDGLHSDVGVHSDLALGVHGHGYAGYAPGYSTGYSSGYLASGGVVGVGGLGHLGGAVVAASPGYATSSGYASSSGYALSTGYAPHAPVLASSVISSPVVSHAPVIAAPAVRFNSFILLLHVQLRRLNFHNIFLPKIEHCYSNTNSDKNSTCTRTASSCCTC